MKKRREGEGCNGKEVTKEKFLLTISEIANFLLKFNILKKYRENKLTFLEFQIQSLYSCTKLYLVFHYFQLPQSIITALCTLFLDEN